MSFYSFKKQLAIPKVSWQLCLLAMLGGLSAAVLIILFTLTIESIQGLYLTVRDNYTSLDALSRFDLPIIGALIILFFSWLTGYQYTRTGIPFVLHRLKIAYGVMPLRNTFNQFIGGAVSLATGFSVGKEGPVVHLGAAASSFIGSVFNLPYNSIRTLCAAGIAAGIAASFNTPIAAVIFVMEVILREYDIHMFIPIMLAAIIGSMLTSAVYGPAHDYEFIGQIALDYHHYPALILTGLFIGLLATGFNRYIIAIIKYFEHWHIFTRLMLAALVTGTLGYFVPYAMGTGSSAVSFLLEYQSEATLLVGLLAAKFLMTIFAIGLGVPGGIVGPIIGIGAIAGGCAAMMVGHYIPGAHLVSDFTLLGMAGFLAATLNAPLAALLTVVELSAQLDIMLPAMIVIATSCLISGQLFKNKSVFIMQLNFQHLAYRKPPIETALQKVGILAQMITEVTLVEQAPASVVKPFGEAALTNGHTSDKPLIIKQQNNDQVQYYWLETTTALTASSAAIQQRHLLIPLSSQVTLAEAYLALLEQRCGGVYVYQHSPDEFLGFVTFAQIRSFLLEGKI